MSRSCEWVRARLTPFLDGELTPEDRAAFEAHLESCGKCREVLEAAQLSERVLHEATAAPGAAEAAEGEAFDGWLAAFRSRHDLEAAAHLRDKEVQAERATRRVVRMSAEEIASAPLEPALRRGATAQRTGARETVARQAGQRHISFKEALSRWFSPAPVWRWLAIGVPATAAAVVAIVLLVQEPRLHEQALEQALGTPTSKLTEGGKPAEMPTQAGQAEPERRELGATKPHDLGVPPRAAPAPAPVATVPPTAAAPTPAPTQAMKAAAPEPPVSPAVHEAEPQPAEEGRPLADETEVKDQAVESAEGVLVEGLTTSLAAPTAEEPWTRIRAFVGVEEDTGARANRKGGEEDLTGLLLAAEERLRVNQAETPPRTSRGIESLSRALRTTAVRPKRDELAPSLTSGGAVTAPEPSTAVWMAVGDGWYELYKQQLTREPSAYESPRVVSARADSTWNAESLTAKALAAYQQAVEQRGLTPEEMTRAQQRIEELRELTGR